MSLIYGSTNKKPKKVFPRTMPEDRRLRVADLLSAQLTSVLTEPTK